MRTDGNNWKILGQILVPVLFFGMIAVSAMSMVWVHQRIYFLSAKTSDLVRKNAALKLQINDLNSEIAALSNPNTIIPAASYIHHMYQPRSEQIIKAEDSKLSKGAAK